MKKLFAVLVALTLVLSMGTIALAAETGSITISNALEGSTYSIYKMLDFAPVDGNAEKGRYTVVSDWAEFIAEDGDGAEYLVEDDESGTVKWNGEETDERKAALAKAAIAYAKKKGIDPTKVSDKLTADGSVTFTEVALGYYAIDTSLGTVCGLTNVNNKFEAHEKNQKPDIDKEVLEDRDNSWGEVNDADIDQIIEYRSTITIGLGATNYVMHDKMEAGLTFNYSAEEDAINNNDVIVKLADGTVVDKTNYTVVCPTEDGDTFDVVFKDSFIEKQAAGSKITVYYYAYLNENAEIAYEGPNVNEVYLSYGESDRWETGKHFTSTYTWKIDVLKFANTTENPEFPLANAKFELLDKDGNAIKFIKNGNTYKVDAEGTVTEIVTDETGKFEIIGLDEGQYALHETKAPEGYNELANDIEVTVTSTIPDQKKHDTKVTYTFTPAEDGTIKVENKTGSLLPETGGIGTTIFYIVGSVLMVAALVLLVSKKRMAAFA